MKDEIKVGQVWTSIFDKSEITVLHLTSNSVVYVSNKCKTNGFIMKFENFHFNFTLKKPDPVLKKLVAWIDDDDNYWIDQENKYNHYNWIKKELIVKDGSVYVDMSEVGK